jgi:hypothetical protein
MESTILLEIHGKGLSFHLLGFPAMLLAIGDLEIWIRQLDSILLSQNKKNG